MITKDDLVTFEQEIAAIYATGVIRAPVHLRSGREDALIEIFRDHQIGRDDYVFGYWDSHELALLKGVPREELKRAILEGKSISLCFPDAKMLCSGIVGSLMGVAAGVAWHGRITKMETQSRGNSQCWGRAGLCDAFRCGRRLA